MSENPEPLSPLKKTMAFFCHHCPMCSYGRKHPDSLVGRVLHSSLHADHCPAWKAEKEAYPPKDPAR